MTTNNYENPTSIKICDYLAEKEEQRLGTDERADAVRDGLSDLETRLIQIEVFAKSIMRYCDSYVEDIGADAPDELQHLQFCLWHLADDVRRFEQDFDRTRLDASALVRLLRS